MKARRQGFTLVELLVVIAIIGLLMAILMPAAGTLWETAYMSQCRARLVGIYKAQNAWRSDQGGTGFATGPEWIEKILPYLEDQAEALMCPLGPNVVATGLEDENTKYVNLGDLVFEIYSGGKLLYDIALDADFIFWTAKSPGRYELSIEDQQTGGDYSSDHRDIVVILQMHGGRNGRPTSIYFSPEHSGHGYNFKFKIKNEIIFHNYDPEGIGQTLALERFGVSMCDYGMSMGSFTDPLGCNVTTLDPKLFFILDYPKSLADYNRDLADDKWDQYFIVEGEEEEWEKEYGSDEDEEEAWTMKDFQALRHFRRANVLFCDGHVEDVAPYPATEAESASGKYLRADSPLWKYEYESD